MKRYSLYSIAAVLLIALVWAGCSTMDRGPVAPTAIGVATKPAAGVIAAQNRHTDRLLKIRGVVGTAIGEREDGSPVIKVFTEAAGVAGIEADLDGIPVDVEVTGKIVALARPGGGSSVNPASRFPRPVPIGVSTGHPNITAGTIGCRVKNAAGNVYALSNNHVYADENRALIGDNALQPGPYDGGVNPADAIGTLAAFVPIVFSTSASNTVDAAIALSSTANLGRSTPSNGYGTPKSATAAAVINLGVMKYGRTTSLTKGKVYALNATVNVGYESGVARFVNQIIIIPGNFSAGGDSGSLIVVEKGTNARKPVGLLFAGSSSVTIANPIDAVLSSFSVTVDGE
jgi:hypothetical protein